MVEMSLQCLRHWCSYGLPPLRLPRTVEVVNLRVLLVYYFLLILTLVLIGTWLLTELPFSVTNPMGGYIHADIWVQPASSDRSAETQRLWKAWNFSNLTRLCAAGKNDDRLNEHSIWAYTNHSCPPPCIAQHQSGCQHPDDAHFRLRQDEIFVATHAQEVFLPDGTGWSEARIERMFFAFSEAFELGLAYHLSLPVRGSASEFKEQVGRPEDVLSRQQQFENVEVNTYVFNSAQEEVTAERVGNGLRFSISDLLELAGEQGALHKRNCEAGAHAGNIMRIKGDDTSCPMGHFSGVELDVHIDCFGDVELNEDNFGHMREKHKCYVTVHRSPRKWVYERQVSARNGGTFIRELNGIRVTVRPGGHGKSFSTSRLLSTFATMWVFLQLPGSLVMIFCVTMLGQLSTIYRQAFTVRFSINEAIRSMTLRLLMLHRSFVELRGSNNEITEALVHRLLEDVLSCRDDVNQAQVKYFTSFCFKVACNAMEDREATISSGDFTHSLTQTEQVQFDAVVKLFDRDRRHGLLEKLFTESRVRKARDCAFKTLEEEQQMGGEETANGMGEDFKLWSYLSLKEFQRLTEEQARSKEASEIFGEDHGEAWIRMEQQMQNQLVGLKMQLLGRLREVELRVEGFSIEAKKVREEIQQEVASLREEIKHKPHDARQHRSMSLFGTHTSRSAPSTVWQGDPPALGGHRSRSAPSTVRRGDPPGDGLPLDTKLDGLQDQILATSAMSKRIKAMLQPIQQSCHEMPGDLQQQAGPLATESTGASSHNNVDEPLAMTLSLQQGKAPVDPEPVAGETPEEPPLRKTQQQLGKNRWQRSQRGAYEDSEPISSPCSRTLEWLP